MFGTSRRVRGTHGSCRFAAHGVDINQFEYIKLYVAFFSCRFDGFQPFPRAESFPRTISDSCEADPLPPSFGLASRLIK